MTHRRNRRSKVVPVQSGPSIADFYRFKLFTPGGGQPTYEEYMEWCANA